MINKVVYFLICLVCFSCVGKAKIPKKKCIKENAPFVDGGIICAPPPAYGNKIL